jgi:hypothetical protein
MMDVPGGGFEKPPLPVDARRRYETHIAVVACRSVAGWNRRICGPAGGGTTIGYKRIIAVPDTGGTQLRIRFDSDRLASTIAGV